MSSESQMILEKAKKKALIRNTLWEAGIKRDWKSEIIQSRHQARLERDPSSFPQFLTGPQFFE